MLFLSAFGLFSFSLIPSFHCFNSMRRLRMVPMRLNGLNFRSVSNRNSFLKATQTAVDLDKGNGVTDLAAFDLPTNDNSPELLRIRHTSAHVMAMAVQKLFPEAQVTIGPWVESG